MFPQEAGNTQLCQWLAEQTQASQGGSWSKQSCGRGNPGYSNSRIPSIPSIRFLWKPHLFAQYRIGPSLPRHGLIHDTRSRSLLDPIIQNNLSCQRSDNRLCIPSHHQWRRPFRNDLPHHLTTRLERPCPVLLGAQHAQDLLRVLTGRRRDHGQE